MNIIRTGIFGSILSCLAKWGRKVAGQAKARSVVYKHILQSQQSGSTLKCLETVLFHVWCCPLGIGGEKNQPNTGQYQAHYFSPPRALAWRAIWLLAMILGARRAWVFYLNLVRALFLHFSAIAYKPGVAVCFAPGTGLGWMEKEEGSWLKSKANWILEATAHCSGNAIILTTKCLQKRQI